VGLSIRQTLFITTAAALVVSTAGTAGAQAKKEPSKGAKQLTWGPAPDAFPAGAKMAVEKGNPMKAGEFTVRLSFPANYKIPPHFHPSDEHVRVVSVEDHEVGRRRYRHDPGKDAPLCANPRRYGDQPSRGGAIRNDVCERGRRPPKEEIASCRRHARDILRVIAATDCERALAAWRVRTRFAI